MTDLTVDIIARNLRYLSFDVYVDGLDSAIIRASGAQLFKEFLANLAVEGVLCAHVSPPEPESARQALTNPTALPVKVNLVRSSQILLEFSEACRNLELNVGSELNGHAPTFFAASRIAQFSGKKMSTIMSNGGLNLSVLNDTLVVQKGRGQPNKKYPRLNEAGSKMAQKKKGVIVTPAGKLSKVLSAEQMRQFSDDLEAVKLDIKDGAIPQISFEEALEIFEPPLK